MNKDLDINQSVSAGEITVTLQRAEMNAVKATVYILTKPPGYALSKERPPEQAESLLTGSAAEYSVDGCLTKKPVDNRAVFNESGAQLIWDLEPIPLDAKELSFNLTKLGDWIGPWEFKVKLE
jgi:hypothetical protein